MQRIWIASLAAVAFLSAASQGAHAYIGPGAGITAIGTVIALIGAILLGIVGFVWYPIKRVRAKKKKRMEKIDEGPSLP